MKTEKNRGGWRGWLRKKSSSLSKKTLRGLLDKAQPPLSTEGKIATGWGGCSHMHDMADRILKNRQFYF